MSSVFKAAFRKGILKLRIPAENIVAMLVRHPVPALTNLEEAAREALNNPVGMPKLTDLVKPGDKVTFLSGDDSYGYASRVGSVILDELKKAGVKREDITHVHAVGTHPVNRDAKEKALGPILSRVGKAVDHDCVRRGDLAFVGVTRYGDPTWTTRYMVESDFNIGLGDIAPGWYGYKGGANIMSPGCAGFETIAYNHRLAMSPDAAPGEVENIVHLDRENSGRLARLDMKVDVISNGGSGPQAGYAAVFAGDFEKEKRAALSLVRRVYGTRMREKADIAVLTTQDSSPPVEYLYSGIYTSILFAEKATKPDGILIPVFSAWKGYHPEPEPGTEGHPSSMHEANRLARMRLEDLARTVIRCECNVRCGALIYPHRRVFDRRRVFLVTEGISKEDGEKLGAAYTTDSFDEALAKALQEKGKDATIAVHLNEWGAMPLFD
ncbi:MAG: lactate racemase domain-containing protein [Candidatus Bathyarchaeia archaeon]